MRTSTSLLLAASLAAPAFSHATATPRQALAKLQGRWSIEAEWGWGASLEAKAIHTPILGDRALRTRVFVSDAGGPMYERYWSILRPGPGNKIFATDFVHDGSVRESAFTIVDDAGHDHDHAHEQPAPITLETSWTMPGQGGETVIDEQLTLTGETLDWQVWMTPAGDEAERSRVMDDAWERITAFPVPVERPKELRHEALKPLEGLLGEWEMVATSPGSQPLHMINEYRVGIGGNFIEVDSYLVSDDEERTWMYHSLYAADPENSDIIAYGFDTRGGLTMLNLEVADNGIIVARHDGEIVQRMVPDGDDAYRWTAYTMGVNEMGQRVAKNFNGALRRARSE